MSMRGETYVILRAQSLVPFFFAEAGCFTSQDDGSVGFFPEDEAEDSEKARLDRSVFERERRGCGLTMIVISQNTPE